MSNQPNPEIPATQLIAHEDAAAHALLAAIAQIGLALRESQGPVAELGSLLSTLAKSLGTLRSAQLTQNGGEAVPVAAAQGVIEQVQADVFRGIEQLQFYDRMVQHLSHLQDYLIAVANELGPLRTPDMQPEDWKELHAKLRKRLISDEQRGLLDLFLSPQTAIRVTAQAVRADYSAPGSTELF